METEKYDWHPRHTLRKIVFGVLVITAGALLIGFNMGLIPMMYKPVLFSWQMLLIAIGLINLISGNNWAMGVILISVGGFFLAPLLHPFGFDWSGSFWPILLIVLGILIIFNRNSWRRRCERHYWHHWHHGRPYDKTLGEQKNDYKFDNGFIKESNFFSGSKHIVPPGEFKGGSVSSVFGGSEIDLTQATLAEGTNFLNIDCTFGGVSLIVPSDWKIHIAVKAIMGGFSDKRRFIKTNGGTGELVIQGSVVFGGGEIKSV